VAVQNKPYMARCIVCPDNYEMVADIGVIKNYALSETHKLSVDSDNDNANDDSENKMQSKSREKIDAVFKAEAELSLFLAQKSVPLNIASDLTKIMKRIFPDSKICQKLRLYAKKTRKILKKVVTPTAKTQITEIMKKVPFSIMIDNYTDASGVNLAAIVVKLFHLNHLKLTQGLNFI